MKSSWARLGVAVAVAVPTLGLTAPASSAAERDSISAYQPGGAQNSTSEPSQGRFLEVTRKQRSSAQPIRLIRPIIGGTGVTNDQYPFMAALLLNSGPESGMQFCAGTLYKPNVILTAAHCVTGRDPEGVSVAVGRTVLSNTQQGQVRAAVSFKIHPRYDQSDPRSEESYDMALIELDKPVEGITPVQMPTPGTDALIRPGAQAVVAGWGLTDDVLEHSPDRMQQVTVPILSQAECQASYGSDEFNTEIDICAGLAGKGSCRGDSGGPLLRKIPGREVPIQIGIVSRGGENCATQEEPGIYTSLSSKELWNTFEQ